MIRIGCLLLACMLLIVSFACADPAADALKEAGPLITSTGTASGETSGQGSATAVGEEPIIPEDGQWPTMMDERGFLSDGEFVYENPDIGVWRYCSSTLHVEIIRRYATEPRKLIWYEA